MLSTFSMSIMAVLAKPVEFSLIKIAIGYAVADPGRTQTKHSSSYLLEYTCY
jgi:hypothetical protein